MAPHPRVLKAFDATRALGIPDEEVKTVLIDLLKVYDKNWELIEEDNYRALLDAYFEHMENKGINGERNGATGSGTKNESRSHLPNTKFNEKRKYHSSFVDAPKVDKLDSKKVTTVCLKSSKTEISHGPFKKEIVRGNFEEKDIKRPKIASIDELQPYKEPLSLAHKVIPGFLECSTSDPISNSLASKLVNMNKKDDGSSHCKCSEGTVDIASSSSGEVKVTLSCNPVGYPSFQVPKLDAVLKFVEDKYLRLYNGQFQFSILKLMKVLCESYLKLGTKSGASRIGVIKKDSSRNSSSGSENMNSHSLVIGLEEHATSDKTIDVTRGTEKVKISIFNEKGNESFPKFNYIPNNIIYQNANIDISLARISDEDCCSSCSGDCLLSSLPCACARETGGEFAYTPQGLLKEEFLRSCIFMKIEPEEHHYVYCQDCPIERSKNEYMPEKCKGHMVRKFIKECWRKCGCDMWCGNRVVQRGIVCKLQVFVTSGGKGWGLRTIQDLPKGTFVCEYVGEIVTNMELYNRVMQSKGNDRHTYPVMLDADWGSEGVLKDEEALCLDATYHGNVGRFINHRCYDANLIDIPVEVETPDHHYYHLAFFTARNVNAFEELTWDYGIDFDDKDHPVKAFQCCCGSASCRDRKHKGTITKKAIKLK